MSDQRERGKPASFDPKSGVVHGSGSGAGGGGNPDEGYDSASMGGGGDEPEGKGHPLPESDEARHDLIPESAEHEKGVGDEGADAIQPGRAAVNPDGESYEQAARGAASDVD